MITTATRPSLDTVIFDGKLEFSPANYDFIRRM